MRYTPTLDLYKPPVYKLFQPQQDLSLCSCRSLRLLPPISPLTTTTDIHLPLRWSQSPWLTAGLAPLASPKP